jgi:uncharacterized protein
MPSLLPASFSGGAAAYFAARRPAAASRLVVVNPLLDYRKRFIDDKPERQDGYLSEDAAERLSEQGIFRIRRPSGSVVRCCTNHS